MGLQFFHRRVERLSHHDLTKTYLMLLMHPTQLWDVHDDDGRRIEWASFDDGARETLDGNLEEIKCLKVASHSNGNAKSGLIRGYWMLSSRRL